MANTIFCSNCGTVDSASARYCQKCGASLWPTSTVTPAAAGTPVAAAPAMPVAVAAPSQQYAGFWIRFLALIIDWVLIRVAIAPLLFILGLQHLSWFRRFDHHIDIDDIIVMVTTVSTAMMIAFCAHWLYEALMTSSSWQATIGKRVLNLKVADDSGNRISFGRATARFFSKILSGMICFIGFIMAAFTDRKKALHDMIAGTVVVRQIG